MELIEWNEDLILGVSELDKEHKLLTDRVNEIIKHANNNSLDYVADEAVSDLLYATRRHFSHEEELMEDIDYPDREIHMAVHKKLMVDLSEKVDVLTLDKDRDTMQTVKFFKDWLIDHIQKDDTELATFVRDTESQKTIDLDP